MEQHRKQCCKAHARALHARQSKTLVLCRVIWQVGCHACLCMLQGWGGKCACLVGRVQPLKVQCLQTNAPTPIIKQLLHQRQIPLTALKLSSCPSTYMPSSPACMTLPAVNASPAHHLNFTNTSPKVSSLPGSRTPTTPFRPRILCPKSKTCHCCQEAI